MRFSVAASAVLLCLLPAASVSAAPQPALEIDGAFCGWVLGGDAPAVDFMVSEVKADPTASQMTKSLAGGNTVRAKLTLAAALPAPLFAMLRSSMARHSVSLIRVENGKAVDRMELRDTLFARIEFPGRDPSAGAAPFQVTLTLATEEIRHVASGGEAYAASPVKSASRLRLAIDGYDVSD